MPKPEQNSPSLNLAADLEARIEPTPPAVLPPQDVEPLEQHVETNQVVPVSHEQELVEVEMGPQNEAILEADQHRTPISAPRSKLGKRHSNRSPNSKSLVTTFSGLSIVLGILMGLVWLARRSGAMRVGSQHAPLVEVLGSYRIGPRSEVSVVRFGSKLLALSITGSGTETLAELDDPQEVAFLTDLCGSTSSNHIPHRLREAVDNLASESRSPRSTYTG